MAPSTITPCMLLASKSARCDSCGMPAGSGAAPSSERLVGLEPPSKLGGGARGDDAKPLLAVRCTWQRAPTLPSGAPFGDNGRPSPAFLLSASWWSPCGPPLLI